MEKKEYRFTEQEAADFAKEASKLVVIRTYTDGCSNDTERKATKAEKTLVEKAIFAALVAIRNHYDADSAKATAEFFIIHGSKYEDHINTYDSIFQKVDNFLSRY